MQASLAVALLQALHGVDMRTVLGPVRLLNVSRWLPWQEEAKQKREAGDRPPAEEGFETVLQITRSGCRATCCYAEVTQVCVITPDANFNELPCITMRSITKWASLVSILKEEKFWAQIVAKALCQ